MEGHGDYTARDRSRLLGSGPRNPVDALAPAGFSEGAGTGGAHTPSVSDLGGRASTPTALTTLAAPYAPRYHLPAALPGSNFALMNSFLSAGGAHSSEARKALVPDVQHFWSVADSFPRYLMTTGSLYPPYPPLFPTPTESALSLLSAGGGAGPSSTHHTTVHYQRLLEYQKEYTEAYLVAANHHLYRVPGVPGVPPTALPPFLDQTPAPAHNNPAASISLVKQEPKELSCAEKASRQAERRSMGVKVDLEHFPGGRDKEEGDGSRGGGGKGDGDKSSGVPGVFMGAMRSEDNNIHRDHKSLPVSSSSPPLSGSTTNKRTVAGIGNNGHTSNFEGNSNNVNVNNYSVSSRQTPHHHAPSEPSFKKDYSSSPSSSRRASNPPNVAPTPAMVPNTLNPTKKSNISSRGSSPNRRSVSKTNSNVCGDSSSAKRNRISTSLSSPSGSSPAPPRDIANSLAPPSNTSSSSSLSASSSSSLSASSSVISIPSFRTTPIPLVSVQHDGMRLSALASPSSAAASASASSKTAGNASPTPGAKAASEKTTPSGIGNEKHIQKTSDIASNRRHHQHIHQRQDLSSQSLLSYASRSSVEPVPSALPRSDEDEDSVVVVDSTEDARKRMEMTKLDRDRAIQETIERVASGVSDDNDEDEERHRVVKASSADLTSSASKFVSVMTSPSSLRSITAESAYVTTSATSFRTVSSLSGQTLSSTLVSPASGSVSEGSALANIATQPSLSNVPYHLTLGPKTHSLGTRKVHAQTYVPEVGVFKGPSPKSMTRGHVQHPSLLSPPLTTVSSVSPDPSRRALKLSSSQALSIRTGTMGGAKQRDSTPSPCLLSPPPLLSPSSNVSSNLHGTSALSPRALTSTPDVTSSIDSASIDSFSVASGRSAIDINEDDSDSSDESDRELTIDEARESEEHHSNLVKADNNSSSCPEKIYADGIENEPEGRLGRSCEIIASSPEGLSVTASLENTTPAGIEQGFVVNLDNPTPELCLKEEAVDYSLPKGTPSRNGSGLSCFSKTDMSSSCITVTLGGSNIPTAHQNAQVNNINQRVTTSSKHGCDPFSAQRHLLMPAHLHRDQAPSLSSVEAMCMSISGALQTFSVLKMNPPHRSAPSSVSRNMCCFKEHPSSARCPSAPLPGAEVTVTPCSVFVPPSMERRDRDHDNGKGSIPVGIPVAQIRPHHVQPSKADEQRPVTRMTDNSPSSGNIHDIEPCSSNTGHGSVSSPYAMPGPDTDESSTLVHPDPSVQDSVAPPSHIINPSLWLQQITLPHVNNPPAVNPEGSSVRYPLRAPAGFNFGHDPATGQIFLIPVPASSEPNNSCVSLKDSGRKSRHSKTSGSAKATSSQSPTDKPSPRIISTLGRDGSRQQSIAQQFSSNGNGNSCTISTHTSSSTVAAISPSTSLTTTTSLPTPLLPHQLLLTAASILAKPPTESRGCSPINFDSSNPTELSHTHYPLILPSCKRPQTFSRAVQTCKTLLSSSYFKKESPSPMKNIAHFPGQADTRSNFPPLSVQCPDIDTAGPVPTANSREGTMDRREYNPFNDPQILQAADGLELLSTLAEKRPKCSSYDDPKRIFPSPSDSFKSDTPSLAAPEDTLSPGDTEPRSGQCTPRRDTRRDLSPKWSLPKKESSSASSQFGDFKAPPGLELVDPVEVRERLAEVQRQYKQKQKELAKLPNRKNDAEIKTSKRGPGRPPKKKLPAKKSDDDSSSSSSKTKDVPQPKKKRPAEELVDRVFRKLPPVKPAKVSRSIHYVKSKTGPFFKRKPAGSSSKRNRDLFGFEEKSWLGMKERKHKKKSGEGKSSKAKEQDVVLNSKDGVFKSEKVQDIGNLFTNLQGSTLEENVSRGGRTPKGKGSSKEGKDGVKSVSIVNVKAEPKVLQIENTVEATAASKYSLSSCSTSTVSHMTSAFSIAPSIASISTGGITTTSSTSSTISSTAVGSDSVSGSSGAHFTSSSLFSTPVPTITFGSISSIMESKELCGPGSFSNSNGTSSMKTGNGSLHSNNTSATTSTAFNGNKENVDSCVRGSAKLCGASSSFSSTAAATSSSSSSYTPAISTAPLFCMDEGSSDESWSGSKHKLDEDSDTDTSDTSPNKKRKPGRPRKISTDKSSGGTETIWAKKSTPRSLLQIPDPGSSMDGEGRAKPDPSSAIMKPLFLDEEWCRRRSERIFLSEPSPQPLPSPRAEPVWKLSNFMPKNTKNTMESTSKAGKSETDTPSSAPASASALFTPIRDSDKALKTEEIASVQPSLTDPPQTSKKSKGKGKDSATKDKVKGVSSGKDSVTPSPTPSMKKARRAHEHTKMKQQKAKSLHDLTQKVKKKYSKSSSKKQDDEKKSPRKMGRKRKASSDSSDIDNVTDAKDRPITPEPRSPVIQQEDLKEGLNVLYLLDGLFYKGIVKAIQPPDVYGVLTAGQRGNRPHILCLEEILREAVMDVCPSSPRYLPEGTRVCAFWSQQFSCLYPGTVAKASPNPYNGSPVNVEFDDGDSGRIPIDHIRLLPSDFPMIDEQKNSSSSRDEGPRVGGLCYHASSRRLSQHTIQDRNLIAEYEPNPLETLPKRRKPSTGSSTAHKESDKKGKTSSKTSSTNDEDDDDDDEDDDDKEDDENEDSDDPDGEKRIWKWAGKSTKRPGLKGRARKEFYKSIVRGKEMISVGDAAVFVSTVRSNCPYIGRIESLWESWGGNKMVRVSWFYHPEETKGGNRLAEPKNALFESPHGDENDVQTISHKCEVLSHTTYKRRLSESRKNNVGSNVFYLAGFYDPSVSIVKFEPGVL